MQFQNIVLFDAHQWQQMLPLSFMRSVADCRIGILTIKEKYEHYFKQDIGILTQNYLQAKYKLEEKSSTTIYINSAIVPNLDYLQQLETIQKNIVYVNQNQEILFFISDDDYTSLEALNHSINSLQKNNYNKNITILNFPWDIFSYNHQAIHNDIELMQLQPNADALSTTNNIAGHNNIYVGENVQADFSTINATKGKVFIGNHATIMEGSLIRGSFALCHDATLKMGAKIYEATTIGPHCKVGGEISNSVIFGYSNKAHDGYLGNSVLAEWCNLGADTNNSNLKNNYSKVKAYSYTSNNYINTNLQFCGLIMADHSKAAINTAFNTGTVVGVFANIFDAGLTPKHIPNFAWGNSAKFELNKAIEVATKVMQRRNIDLSNIEHKIIEYLYNI
ncbi:MAG: glucose-1-phosphate thymidylyltransferase [Chitinophagales bacterium]|nr:glucose-1-phosphate thymidylyltransferase [Chitinophagales bacterium]